MSYVMIVDSPKLQAMLGRCYGIVNVQKRKLLIFVGGPLALYGKDVSHLGLSTL